MARGKISQHHKKDCEAKICSWKTTNWWPEHLGFLCQCWGRPEEHSARWWPSCCQEGKADLSVKPARKSRTERWREEGGWQRYLGTWIQRMPSILCIVAEQNPWPQNMPLWHMDYFELKLIKTQQTQEKLLPLPQLSKKHKIGILAQKDCYYQRSFLSERSLSLSVAW